MRGIQSATVAGIVAIAATKGGVGKTTLAYELAAALPAVLIDLDWDSGGATEMWGHDPYAYRRAPLLDALEAGPDGRPPRVRRDPLGRQPPLVPSHPDLGATRLTSDLVADCLISWHKEWGTDTWVLVDTHPGGNVLTDGAMQAAHLVVVPAVLGQRELAALQGMLALYAEYPLLVVPSMVPPAPPRALVGRLAELTNRVPVAPVISEHRWLRRRRRRAAVVAQSRPGREVHAAAVEYRRVADAVRSRIG